MNNKMAAVACTDALWKIKKKRVGRWAYNIEVLSVIAQRHPQAALTSAHERPG